jgi:hypothetical protein
LGTSDVAAVLETVFVSDFDPACLSFSLFAPTGVFRADRRGVASSTALFVDFLGVLLESLSAVWFSLSFALGDDFLETLWTFSEVITISFTNDFRRVLAADAGSDFLAVFSVLRLSVASSSVISGLQTLGSQK